ncbi:MAG: Na+/H+ antiporter subunit E [Acidimicrobiia bacterium]|nr:Na+/H+ antiporter subunit E [Acidimicrobiia bacterium]
MKARLLVGAWLVVVWVALWGDVSAANVVSGVVVSAVLLTFFPLGLATRPGRFRPLWVLRLLGYFSWKLVEANAVVAWEVVTPRNRINEGIVAVPVTGASDVLVSVVANAISLTPGTLTIEVATDPNVLYVHVLHLHDIDAVRRDVTRLERSVLRAFGTDEAVAEVERRLAALDDTGASQPGRTP